MSMFTSRLRPVAYLAIGVLTLALAQSANAQGCRGGGGGMGYSRGGMGGYTGGGYSNNGYSNSGYAGGTGQSNGMMGGYQGQGLNSSGSQNYSSPLLLSSNTNATVNNPSTVLAHTDDLKLTSKQVQSLEKMLSSGKQRAALVLTKVQRKQLAAIIGPARKSGSI